jgi:hypothetical protein
MAVRACIEMAALGRALVWVQPAPKMSQEYKRERTSPRRASVEICGFFGITMEMFERVYGHHHPDYQSNAVNALNRTRQLPDRINGIKREHRGQESAPPIENTQQSSNLTRSGRGGRRFKSCHSDHYLAEICSPFPTETALALNPERGLSPSFREARAVRLRLAPSFMQTDGTAMPHATPPLALTTISLRLCCAPPSRCISAIVLTAASR